MLTLDDGDEVCEVALEELKVKHQFDDADAFVLKIKKWAENRGFEVCKSGKFFIPPNNPHPVHSTQTGITWRASLYCNFKSPSDKSNKAVKSSCPWCVKFSYNRSLLLYTVTSSCLDHTHQTIPQGTSSIGTNFIKKSSQLGVKEIDIVQGMGRYNIPRGKVREIVECQNPGRIYCPRLLFRLMERGRQLYLGKDPDSMTKFFELGFSLRSDGGLFVFDLDSVLSLKSVMLQVTMTVSELIHFYF